MAVALVWITLAAAAAKAVAQSAAPAPAPSATGPQPEATETPAAASPVSGSGQHTIIPAGTKVLLSMKSAVNTKTAQVGDGVYLVSTFPVVVGDHVVIPPGVYVQGVIDEVQRHTKIMGKTQLHMHFTSMIFPNGNVVVIPGIIHSVPGSGDTKMSNDQEGTVEHTGTKGKDAGTIASTTLPGAEVGSIAGISSGHTGEGALLGSGAGLIIGVAMVMFGHNDVFIDANTPIEMVLQRPLELMPAQTAGMSTTYVPAPNQRQPMPKPSQTGHEVTCAAGAECQ